MREARERTGAPEEDRLQLDFALGKGLEDAGRYEESFRSYERGAAVRRSRPSGSPRSRIRYI